MTATENVLARLSARADQLAAAAADRKAQEAARLARAKELAARVKQALEPLTRWPTDHGPTAVVVSSAFVSPSGQAVVGVSVKTACATPIAGVHITCDDRGLSVRCDGMDFEPDNPTLGDQLLDRLVKYVEAEVTGHRLPELPF